jgi:hypothetical protein
VSEPPGGQSLPVARRAAGLLAEAGWTDLFDRVIHGVCHDLNGRVTSLHAVTQLVELGEGLPPTFGVEEERLAQIARGLMMIPYDLGAEPNAAILPELMERVLSIHDKVRDVELSKPHLTVGEEVPPVLVNEGRCVRALVLVVDRYLRHAPKADAAIRVAASSGDAEVSLPGAADALSETEAEALAEVLAMDGVELRGNEDELRVVFPSLARAREESR